MSNAHLHVKQNIGDLVFQSPDLHHCLSLIAHPLKSIYFIGHETSFTVISLDFPSVQCTDHDLMTLGENMNEPFVHRDDEDTSQVSWVLVFVFGDCLFWNTWSNEKKGLEFYFFTTKSYNQFICAQLLVASVNPRKTRRASFIGTLLFAVLYCVGGYLLVDPNHCSGLTEVIIVMSMNPMIFIISFLFIWRAHYFIAIQKINDYIDGGRPTALNWLVIIHNTLAVWHCL